MCVLVFWSPKSKVQTGKVNVVNIPNNTYHASDEVNKRLSSTSDQIIKKTPLTGARIVADKLVNSLFVYAPKGMAGSRNSNFYEFLSMGLIPNVVGSLMLILLFNGANKYFKNPDRAFANIIGRKMTAGVVLYAIGKWLGSKLINKGVQAKTGIDFEMPYKKVVTELPDHPGDKDLTKIEYHRVFESVDFPRFDLINKMGEQQGNRHLWWDKIARKMGFKDYLNSPEQMVQEKVRETAVKTSSARYISSFFWAAMGVALAAQSPFERKIFSFAGRNLKERVFNFCNSIFRTFKKSFIDLYNGSGGNFGRGSKTVGRAIIFAALASTVLGIFNATRGFKVANNQPDTQIDIKKEYEVC